MNTNHLNVASEDSSYRCDLHRIRCRQTLALYAVAIMLLVPACTTATLTPAGMFEQLSGESKKKKDDLPPAGPTKVVTDASALALQMPESDLEARNRFEQQFAALMDEDRNVAADILVARHPEHAYEVLTSRRGDGQSPHPALAHAYDRFCKTSDGWHAVANTGDREAVAHYFAQRSQWMGQLAAGNFEATASIDLVELAEATTFRTLIVDALYQAGIGNMLRNDNTNAAKTLQKCAQLAGDDSGMLGPGALLLCAEAYRRSENYQAANATWEKSVTAASELLAQRGVSDPTFWERATYLHPVNTPWPTAVATNFQRFASSPKGVLQAAILQQLATVHTTSEPIAPSCWVETAIGAWQHERGETHKAIVRFKKAETLATDEAVDWLHIAQAKELVVLGQPGTATTLLARLIGQKKDTPAKFAAMAELGVYRLQSGDAQQGVRLLSQAINNKASLQWPGRATAEADYALGLLMIGETDQGENILADAQRRFEAEGELELLAKSLWNELKYLEHQEADAEVIQAVQTRLDTLRL